MIRQRRRWPGQAMPWAQRWTACGPEWLV